jgi:hypothetical protein
MVKEVVMFGSLLRVTGFAALTMVAIGSTAASMSADVKVPVVAIARQLSAPIEHTSSAPALACAIDLAKDFASVTRLHGTARPELTTVARLGCRDRAAASTGTGAASLWSMIWNVLRNAATHLLDALAGSLRV